MTRNVKLAEENKTTLCCYIQLNSNQPSQSVVSAAPIAEPSHHATLFIVLGM